MPSGSLVDVGVEEEAGEEAEGEHHEPGDNGADRQAHDEDPAGEYADHIERSGPTTL